jgi:hypothetical protein
MVNSRQGQLREAVGFSTWIPEFNSNRSIKLYTIMAWDCAKQQWKSARAEGFPFKIAVYLAR